MLNTTTETDIEKIETLVHEGMLETMSISELQEFIQECEEKVKSSSFEKFLEYNERDVELVERLDDKLKFIQNLIELLFIPSPPKVHLNLQKAKKEASTQLSLMHSPKQRGIFWPTENFEI